jgi:hypothetical protein
MKSMWLMVALTGLSGCAALTTTHEKNEAETNQPATPILSVLDDDVCVFNNTIEAVKENCELTYWVGLWVQADNTAWPLRKSQIAALGETPADKLHKILLSMPVDTPYQDRLRAKHWLDEITPVFTPQIQQAVATLVASPNNQMLEYESAISMLSKVNTQRALNIESLKSELEAQRKKLEELLQIEATLMDKNRSTQQ